MTHCRKSYAISSSPFFGLSSKKKLSELLGVSLHVITDLRQSGLHRQYRIFKDRKTQRLITEPVGELLRVHQKILKLFKRIQPPAYLHSAIKKRSYKTNAEAHLENRRTLKIDLKKFFPSIRFHHVYGFFLKNMQCSSDIATILANLCTANTKNHGTHLPTGSCISPLLSYWINQSLFDQLHDITSQEGCRMTLYVDDITISGEKATPEFLNKIAIAINSYGYKYHKVACYGNGVATITGLIVNEGRLELPHARAQKIRSLEKELMETENDIDRKRILNSLMGRLAEAEQIVPAYTEKKNKIMKLFENVWDDIVQERARRARLKRGIKKKTVLADISGV